MSSTKVAVCENLSGLAVSKTLKHTTMLQSDSNLLSSPVFLLTLH